MDWTLYWTILAQIAIGFVPLLLMIFFFLSAIKYAVSDRPTPTVRPHSGSTPIYSTESDQ